MMGAGILLPLPWKYGAISVSGHGLTAPKQMGGRSESILNPREIPKYVEPLVIPPVMEPTGVADNGTTLYEIAVRAFEQQILPGTLPRTPVFGYGRAGDPLPGNETASSFNFPAYTIEARRNQAIRVTWHNHLVDDPDSDAPKFRPHLLPVDQTLHWANPPQPDSRSQNPLPYLGPVPIVPHLHGGHNRSVSDGLPETWFLPAASNIPAGFAEHGTYYATVAPAPPGAVVFEYHNDQLSGTLWYHDHALGITRLNVYAGLAGFYLLRDEAEATLDLPGPAPQLGDEPATHYYEIPLAIQDRSFNEDGSLFYPTSRQFFDGFEGPYYPEGIVPPIWNPEFFGNTIVVNGKTWPYLEVEPRLYRLRLLNGCNARFLILKFDQNLPFTVIGSDGGFLPDHPVEVGELLMGPAERFDVLVDFSQFEVGEETILLNLGPDEPFGGLPIERDAQADRHTTGQIMQFRVVQRTDSGNEGSIPAVLPAIERLQANAPERFLTLNEEMTHDEEEAVVSALLGTVADGPLAWSDPIVTNPIVNDTEIWNFVNLTADAHPIHVHEVMFQILGRVPFDAHAFHEAQEAYLLGRRAGDPPDPFEFATGGMIPPGPLEMGWKDTVIANPDEITRIIMKFLLEGLYVWHCHILEHEDNEMMRPYYIGLMPETDEPPRSGHSGG